MNRAAASDLASLLPSIPAPIAGGLGFLFALTALISEVRGWTHGPLNKKIEQAAAVVATSAADRLKAEDGWRARDRRVEELEEVVNGLKERMDTVARDLAIAHKLGDAQNKLLVGHSNWDRMAQAEINRIGGNLRPPPPLYVYDEEE